MKIAIGADHRGFDLKEIIKKAIVEHRGTSIEWLDVGACDKERSDYPVFVQKVCQLMIAKKADTGILLCGSGVGMSIAANRYTGIYAALVWNELVARKSKEDDNSNVLVLPADFISADLTLNIIKSWFSAQFKGGRYQKRLDMIEDIK